MEKYPIDFVVPWVDGADAAWRAQKQQYEKPNAAAEGEEHRYRDWGLFKYWFRAVEQYAPWVHRIYLVTWGHLPLWLNTKAEKLQIVRHEDYIPGCYLPTFNSNTIELNIHRIPNLTEHFVYFNDDMYLMNPVKEEDFFVGGLPRAHVRESFTVPFYGDSFPHILFNNLEVINRHFSKRAVQKCHPSVLYHPRYGKDALRNLLKARFSVFTGFQNLHLSSAFLKSTFEEVWIKEEDILSQTCAHRFRSKEDVNQYLIQAFQWFNGRVVPQSDKIGRYFTISESEQAVQALARNKMKIICINDNAASMNELDEVQRKIRQAFEKKLSQPSVYETAHKEG